MSDTAFSMVLRNIDLAEVVKFINWTYFFSAWRIHGIYPGIENLCGCEACLQKWLLQFQPEMREKALEARRLYSEATEALRKMSADNTLQIDAIVLICDAKAENEGITIYPDNSGKTVHLPMLRQQHPNEKSGFCISLSDFISEKRDSIGIFAVSVHGAERIAEKHIKTGDDFNALLVKSLADRLAEAASEWLHRETRKKIWGYAPDENLSIEELRQCKYQGIRPAVGYPSIPDQSILFELDKILDLRQIGITLTENGAMSPASSICGLYISHPKSFYFMVGEIGEDQLNDYAKRRNMQPDKLRKFLSCRCS